jgi:hypothetical protein
MIQRYDLGANWDDSSTMSESDNGDYILVEDLLALAEPWLDDVVPLGNAETALYHALKALRGSR